MDATCFPAREHTRSPRFLQVLASRSHPKVTRAPFPKVRWSIADDGGNSPEMGSDRSLREPHRRLETQDYQLPTNQSGSAPKPRSRGQAGQGGWPPIQGILGYTVYRGPEFPQPRETRQAKKQVKSREAG